MFKITVGICCYKQGKWLHRCLRSLCDQSIDKSTFEVVIVNDDPAERLDCICETFKDHLNIRIINNTTNIGLPGSLNKILKSALRFVYAKNGNTTPYVDFSNTTIVSL